MWGVANVCSVLRLWCVHDPGCTQLLKLSAFFSTCFWIQISASTKLFVNVSRMKQCAPQWIKYSKSFFVVVVFVCVKFEMCVSERKETETSRFCFSATLGLWPVFISVGLTLSYTHTHTQWEVLTNCFFNRTEIICDRLFLPSRLFWVLLQCHFVCETTRRSGSQWNNIAVKVVVKVVHSGLLLQISAQ